MRRLLIVCTGLLATLALQGCSDKNGAPAGASPGNKPAQTAGPSRETSRETPAAGDNAAAEAGNAGTVLPLDIPSETDDGQETTDSTAAGVQPTFKLGSTPPAPPTSARFREGTHYQKIVPAQPTSAMPDQVEVLEIFWYGCGNCFALDTAIDSWRSKSKAPYVEFVRLPAMWDEAQRLQARVSNTAEMLG